MAILSEIPDPNNLQPPRPARVRTWDGERYVAFFGDTSSVDTKFKPVYRNSFEAAWSYLEGAPQGIQGIALGGSPKVCLWRHYDIGEPSAKKTWDSLSERTKQGYRGRMRANLGLRSESAFARFYSTADTSTMRWLRRHGPMPDELVVGPTGEALHPSGDGEWVTTWEQQRRGH